MNKDIDTTIEQITSSILMLHSDIEQKNPAGICRFVDEFVPMLNRLGDLMLKSEFAGDEYYQKMRTDISQVFTQLFAEGLLFQAAHDVVKDDGVTEARIMAMKRNGNPLAKGAEVLKKSPVQVDYFKAFVQNHGGIFDKGQVLSDTDRAHLTLIYNRYKDEINEPISRWLERFVYPSDFPVPAMSLEKEAREGSRRLVILAILGAIRGTKGNTYNFDDFALVRFGIKGYRKAFLTHKDKQEFENVVQACNKIIVY